MSEPALASAPLLSDSAISALARLLLSAAGDDASTTQTTAAAQVVLSGCRESLCPLPATKEEHLHVSVH